MGIKRINGNRQKIIGRLRRATGKKVSEQRRKTRLAQNKLINRIVKLWNEYGTSDSLVIPIMRYHRRLCTRDFQTKLDAELRKKNRWLETEINLTDGQIRIRPSIREI